MMQLINDGYWFINKFYCYALPEGFALSIVFSCVCVCVGISGVSIVEGDQH